MQSFFWKFPFLSSWNFPNISFLLNIKNLTEQGEIPLSCSRAWKIFHRGQGYLQGYLCNFWDNGKLVTQVFGQSLQPTTCNAKIRTSRAITWDWLQLPESMQWETKIAWSNCTIDSQSMGHGHGSSRWGVHGNGRLKPLCQGSFQQRRHEANNWLAVWSRHGKWGNILYQAIKSILSKVYHQRKASIYCWVGRSCAQMGIRCIFLRRGEYSGSKGREVELRWCYSWWCFKSCSHVGPMDIQNRDSIWWQLKGALQSKN